MASKPKPTSTPDWPLWMTAQTAALYLDFQHAKNPRACFWDFARRHHVVARGRRGDTPLFHRHDLDRLVTVVDGEVPEAFPSGVSRFTQSA